MELGMIGLGKMGGNMTTRLQQHGHQVVAFDPSPEAVRGAEAQGARGVASLEALVQGLGTPRAIWMMIPAGAPVDDTIGKLLPQLSRGDLLIDGGNSRWTDTKRRAAYVGERGIGYLDVGTSGGIWGLERGYCMMVGGDAAAFSRVKPLLDALTPEGGLAHVGPSGAGHFTKMVHNAIEYGMMAAMGEGFELLHASEYDLDLHQLADLWNHGSVIQSWLVELAGLAFAQEGNDLPRIEGIVADSGEGRWTLEEAIARAVPMPVLSSSLFERFRSRQPESFAAKVLAALRHQFGGHAVVTVEEK